MKVAIILGRGIEGCGVTKFSLEQNKWFNASLILFKLNKVYSVGKYTLRGKVTIQSLGGINRTHILTLSNKKQSVISAVGYSVTVTGLDIESQTMIIEVKFKR